MLIAALYVVAEHARRHRHHPGHARACGRGSMSSSPTSPSHPSRSRSAAGARGRARCTRRRCACGGRGSARPGRSRSSLIAAVGPFFAPYCPTDFVGAPNSRPRTRHLRHRPHRPGRVEPLPLGRPRDPHHGGASDRPRPGRSAAAIGLSAAYSRNTLDDVLMRAMDVILAFPQIMLALVAIATVGPQAWLIVLTVGLTTMPRVARVTRGAASRSSNATSSQPPRRSGCRACASCARGAAERARARCWSRQPAAHLRHRAIAGAGVPGLLTQPPTGPTGAS